MDPCKHRVIILLNLETLEEQEEDLDNDEFKQLQRI